MTVHLTYGPPGCGKTTDLEKLARRIADQRGGKEVLIASLTRAAAAEIGLRDTGVPADHCGTLHSICYHALGCPTVAEGKAKDWNQAYPQWSIATQSGVEDEVEASLEMAHPSPGFDITGDQLLASAQLFRAQMVPVEEWHLRHDFGRQIVEFHEAWTEWKDDCGHLDFTDLIEQAIVRHPTVPKRASVLLFDEAQDYSKLEATLCQSWAEEASHTVFVGDPDQCQPGETVVETVEGRKCIANLRDGDRVLAYSREDKLVVGKRNGGFAVKVGHRPYSGWLVKIDAMGRSTRCTPNHKWICKWTREAKTSKKRCVYLMRRGQAFRVGHCQLFRADSCFHVWERARNEKADAVWILDVFDTSEESYAYEAIVAARYGIPQLPFEPCDNAKNVTETTIELVFDALGDLTKKGRECLEAHGLMIEHPFKDSGNGGSVWERQSNVLKLHACNVIGGLMMVPVYDGTSKPEWQPFFKSWHQYTGFVYSLDVEGHGTYVADGLCTCNSLYEWRGADARMFMDMDVDPERKRVLGQSYRVPRHVCEYATRWIRQISDREDVEYASTLVEGEIEHTQARWGWPGDVLPFIEQAEAGDESLMILTSCNYMLQPITALLRTEGVRFHNPYRRKNGSWNPIKRGQKKRISAFDRVEALANLVNERDHAKIQLWLDPLKSEILTKGSKQRAKNLEVGLDHASLRDLFVNESDFINAMDVNLDWYCDNITASKSKPFTYPCQVMARYAGKEASTSRMLAALQDDPKVIIGTCHSVKGGEADNVLVFPDISRAASDSIYEGGFDAVCRQFYVGLTRTKRRLYLGKAMYGRRHSAVEWL